MVVGASTSPSSPTASPCALFSPRLYRGEAILDTLETPLTCAGLQATRLASLPDGQWAFASGTDVFVLTPTIAEHKRARAAPGVADDYLSPRALDSQKTLRLTAHSAHTSEVQSVASQGSRLASVDAYGRCIVTEQSEILHEPQGHADANSLRHAAVLEPAQRKHGEPGWAGAAISGGGGVAIARELFWDVSFYDGAVLSHVVHTTRPPTALTSADKVLAVAEGGRVALYDARAHASQVGASDVAHGAKLLGIDASSDALSLVVAGTDRAVHLIDVRMMGVRERWTACLKYECAGVRVCEEREGMSYVCSVDNEVACGALTAGAAEEVCKLNGDSASLMISGANAKSSRRAFGFRADVRIIGMDTRQGECEEVGVLSESGAFYLMRPHAVR